MEIDLAGKERFEAQRERQVNIDVRTLLFDNTSRPLTTLMSASSCGVTDTSVNTGLLAPE